MIRIFSSLAIFSVLCVAAALFLGIFVGDLQAVKDPRFSVQLRQETLQRFSVHWLAGLGAALVVILVNSISMTYFIGTSRWCKEVVERYSLDPALLRRSQSLKRRTFPWAVVSMLAIIGVAALGAAADPGTGAANTADWVLPHYIAALAAVALLAYSYFAQAANLRAHYDLINDIVNEVRRMRAERGLEV